MKSPITIIDYGAGNLESIANMLKKIGVSSWISSDPGKIADAEKLLLPGVGAFDYGMNELRKRNLEGPILEKVKQGTPLLGICLGMQMLGNGSEEGQASGLGLIAGKCVKFNPEKFDTPGLKVPHMGWNDTIPLKTGTLFENNSDEYRFYYVHSYHFQPENAADALASCHYGYDFTSAIEHGNVMGVQFHPEKSHRFGMKLLTRFASL